MEIGYTKKFFKNNKENLKDIDFPLNIIGQNKDSVSGFINNILMDYRSNIGNVIVFGNKSENNLNFYRNLSSSKIIKYDVFSEDGNNFDPINPMYASNDYFKFLFGDKIGRIIQKMVIKRVFEGKKLYFEDLMRLRSIDYFLKLNDTKEYGYLEELNDYIEEIFKNTKSDAENIESHVNNMEKLHNFIELTKTSYGRTLFNIESPNSVMSQILVDDYDIFVNETETDKIREVNGLNFGNYMESIILRNIMYFSKDLKMENRRLLILNEKKDIIEISDLTKDDFKFRSINLNVVYSDNKEYKNYMNGTDDKHVNVVAPEKNILRHVYSEAETHIILNNHQLNTKLYGYLNHIYLFNLKRNMYQLEQLKNNEFFLIKKGKRVDKYKKHYFYLK